MIERFAKAIGKGPAFSDSIDLHIKAIQGIEKRLQKTVTQHLHGRVGLVDSTVVRTSMTVEQIDDKAAKIEENTVQIKKALEGAPVEIQKMFQAGMSAQVIEIMNGMKDVLGSHVDNSECEWNDYNFSSELTHWTGQTKVNAEKQKRVKISMEKGMW